MSKSIRFDHAAVEANADQTAFTQGVPARPVTYREVTTQDLIASAVRYNSARSQMELQRRGIDWAAYA